MNRESIIKELKKYFKIQELVGRVTYRVHKNRAWKFFSTEALHMLLILRENIDAPITINTWHKGGNFSQRGLRTNVQNIFSQLFKSGKLYLSGHVLGEAFDLDVKGMSANQVREWIVYNQRLFPFKIRLEHKKNGKDISWVHIDCIQESKNSKVHLFNV